MIGRRRYQFRLRDRQSMTSALCDPKWTDGHLRTTRAIGKGRTEQQQARGRREISTKIMPTVTTYVDLLVVVVVVTDEKVLSSTASAFQIDYKIQCG